jgi:hypothetical protein
MMLYLKYKDSHEGYADHRRCHAAKYHQFQGLPEIEEYPLGPAKASIHFWQDRHVREDRHPGSNAGRNRGPTHESGLRPWRLPPCLTRRCQVGVFGTPSNSHPSTQPRHPSPLKPAWAGCGIWGTEGPVWSSPRPSRPGCRSSSASRQTVGRPRLRRRSPGQPTRRGRGFRWAASCTAWPSRGWPLIHARRFVTLSSPSAGSGALGSGCPSTSPSYVSLSR